MEEATIPLGGKTLQLTSGTEGFTFSSADPKAGLHLKARTTLEAEVSPSQVFICHKPSQGAKAQED
jgi:hypothetical protein